MKRAQKQQHSEDDVETSSASDGTQDPHGTSTSSDEERLPLPRRQGSDPTAEDESAVLLPLARRSLRRSTSENSLRSPRGKPDLIESQKAIKVQEYSDDEEDEEHHRLLNSELPVDVMAIVLSLRKQRNRGMVQNEDQYNFIYRAVIDELANQKIELSPVVLEFMQSSMKVSNDVGIVKERTSSSKSPRASLGLVRSTSRGLSRSAELVKTEPVPTGASTSPYSVRTPRKAPPSYISPSSMDVALSPPHTTPLFDADSMDVDNPAHELGEERDMSEGSDEEEYDSDLSDEDDFLYQSRGGSGRRRSRRAVRRAAPGADWRHQSMGIPPPAPGSPPYSSGLPPEFADPLGIPPTHQFASMQL